MAPRDRAIFYYVRSEPRETSVLKTSLTSRGPAEEPYNMSVRLNHRGLGTSIRTFSLNYRKRSVDRIAENRACALWRVWAGIVLRI